MVISHQIDPKRAAQLIDTALGLIDTEHPIWLELSLLGDQLEVQAKRVIDAELAADKEVELLRKTFNYKLGKLKDALTYVFTTHVLIENSWIKNKVSEGLVFEMMEVVQNALELVPEDSFLCDGEE